MVETCRRWPRCADIPAHSGTRHNDPRDELYDGPASLLQVLPLAVRESARKIVAEAPALTPEVVDLGNHIQFLRDQVAHVRVDKDRQVRDAMARSESCEHHGEEIKALGAQVHHFNRQSDKNDAGRVALLGFLHAVDESVRFHREGKTNPDVTVDKIMDALAEMSRKAHAAHTRAWSR